MVITLDGLSELFYYDDKSLSGIAYKNDKRCGHMGNGIASVKGNMAGWVDRNGYWRVKVGDRTYQTNRVVWYLINGSLDDDLVVDHIDGNPSNNSIENLRAISETMNMENKSKYSNNTSGVCGVKWHCPSSRNPKNTTYAVAAWHNRLGQKRSRGFSTSIHGLLPAFLMACNYRDKMIAQLNEQGASYTTRHGT